VELPSWFRSWLRVATLTRSRSEQEARASDKQAKKGQTFSAGTHILIGPETGGRSHILTNLFLRTQFQRQRRGGRECVTLIAGCGVRGPGFRSRNEGVD
jgi:hypothetical protein